MKLLLEGFIFEVGQWAGAVLPFENQPVSLELRAPPLCVLSAGGLATVDKEPTRRGSVPAIPAVHQRQK